jgi:3-oxoacyl-[acyl-carrier protein] reductase
MSDRATKVAIVTGASGGIGRVIALRLARDGFAVVASYAGNPAKAEEAVGEIVRVEEFDRTIAINLRGSFLIMSRAARHLGEGGRIILVSSSVIGVSLPTYAAYIASKAGVEGMMRVLANELRGRGISVNAVAPGPVATELFLHGKTEAQIERFRTLAPLERLGRPEDVAPLVSFLAGPEGGWVNGQVLRVNGGYA